VFMMSFVGTRPGGIRDSSLELPKKTRYFYGQRIGSSPFLQALVISPKE
jgi:hypothetical protein